jgi:hypothetical protein
VRPTFQVVLRRFSERAFIVFFTWLLWGTCHFYQFHTSPTSATKLATMALMDLCGISNLRWDLSPLYLRLPTVKGRLESGHLQSNGKDPEIETQKAPLTNLESFIQRRMQGNRLENPLRTENHKPASPSTSASPRQ